VAHRFKALISDLGGVVVRVDPTPLREFIAERSGLPVDASWQRFYDHPSWRDCEAGRTDLAGVARAISDLFGVPVTGDEVTRVWCSVFPGAVEGVAELYGRVRDAGLRLIALSNTIPEHMGYLRSRFGEMAMFEKIYTSYEIGARKPDPAAFLHVLDDTGLAAGECVYVDDFPKNVAAAAKLGMAAIHARQGEEVQAGLRALGVLA